MKTARLITPWTGDGQSQATAFRPQLTVDYALLTCVDVTGQPASHLLPSPNAFLVEITCTDQVMNQIQADPNYAGGILWVE